ncbi:MAG: hypothetical protein LVR00_00015 [Rhabdochlamydiaceae bacterium]|jgi:hypothetical protein
MGKIYRRSKKTRAKAASAARKALAFFKEGLIGKAITKTTKLSVAEVAASQAAAILAALPARSLGAAVGASALGPVSVLSTAAASAAFIAAANPTSTAKLFQRFRELSGLKGIIMILGLSALIALYFQHAKDLEEIGQNLGGALFEKLGSLIASIIAGYQVSRLSSGLSFQEYLQRNLQQVGAVTVFDAAFKPNPWVKMPWDLTVGIIAYNAAPIRDLIKTVHRMMTTSEADLALKIKNYFNALQAAELQAAIEERNAASARGERNLTRYEARISELTNQSTVMQTLYTNMHEFIRLGFQSFVDYQKMLTESDAIGAAQAEFIEIYRRAKLFENAVRTGGIQSTDEYRQAVQANPEIAQNPSIFKDECLARYTSEQNRVKNNLVIALDNAARQKLTFSNRILKWSAGSHIEDITSFHIGTLPEVNELETLLIGFPLTDPGNAYAAKALASIHMQLFLSMNTGSIVSHTGRAFLRTVFGQASGQGNRIDKKTELRFIEGLLKLVLNHYDRTLPDSAVIGAMSNTLPFAFTWLREGMKAAISESRSRNSLHHNWETIEESDHFFDAVEEQEDDGVVVLSQVDIDEAVQAAPAQPAEPSEQTTSQAPVQEVESTILQIDGEEEDHFFDVVQDPVATVIEMPEDNGITVLSQDEINAARAESAQQVSPWKIVRLFRKLIK